MIIAISQGYTSTERITSGKRIGKIMKRTFRSHNILRKHGFLEPFISILGYPKRSSAHIPHTYGPRLIRIHIIVIMSIMMKSRPIGFQYTFTSRCIFCTTFHITLYRLQFPHGNSIICLICRYSWEMRQIQIHIIRYQILFICLFRTIYLIII